MAPIVFRFLINGDRKLRHADGNLPSARRAAVEDIGATAQDITQTTYDTKLLILFLVIDVLALLMAWGGQDNIRAFAVWLNKKINEKVESACAAVAAWYYIIVCWVQSLMSKWWN
ncbi:hypothetical protein EJ03DRAFT_328734 [Teratosphaeria nubilosa]|uniref:Uncharacterized protein n=1 Tax=Teratosphaeria nubilosa TaxID=161662 RepID=A0A6G1L625_9PEZI|nr:hypothetical protein EJ03DRAFT_328734 [Teratosphaeria nubilosa]